MKSILRDHIEEIVQLTDAEFDYVLPYFTLKKYRKHQFVIQEGDRVPNDFFVLSGCLKSYYTDQTGRMHILQFGWEDWWITDYHAYYNQTRATINIDCNVDSELLCLSLHNREKLCAEMRKIEYFFRKKADKANVAFQKRILSLLSNNAQERYDQLLQLYPELFQRLNKQHLAAYLGVTRETLSRFNSSAK